MIEALDRGRRYSAKELGRRFSSAQPTISKHLKVLERAGLVERNVVGRQHLFQLRREPLDAAVDWIARHRAFWTGAADRLEDLLMSDVSDD